MSEFYQRYAATFLTGLADYARVTAVLTTEAEDAGYITISQRLDVDSSPLIVALAASVDAFYALASGYSGVSLDGMDELAVDAVGELFNVINGHFSSRMREDGIAVSIIDPPRHCHGAAEPVETVFSHGIASPVGGMYLMAAHEEFLAAEPH
ncbi:hypothetical protein HMPREF9334_01598 [Selenomonas infelix ATCC 43532]|uniref:Chemotaxis phosphatase CheX-like domain-containing protein n=1 Tax=Selenomonas infelix ATCC 43532 TaxID=679201 RepID=G5GQR7_9FIRM|nr:hypothetical protein [Selenomonas infelix]EHG20702.1 hypothetical protein HMPREF9334_01598 [Selenomonas infelix ATCC 43532]